MIKTKSIHDPADLSDGRRILVMRFWPRRYSKEQLKLAEFNGWRQDLAPSKQLLRRWYNRTITWSQYITQYCQEMLGQQTVIAELANLAKTQTVTLLCVENENNPHCHRHLLKSLIEKAMRNP